MKVHPGATLTPHFRDFLPPWIARQPWYLGSSMPSFALIGAFRFEDPAGQVGIETHLLFADSVLYQVPMTYRDAPLDGPALIATAEHSVLGTRWIYDAEADPVWMGEISTLVQSGGTSEPSAKRGVGFAEARGRRLGSGLGRCRIDLVRRLIAGPCPDDPAVVGTVMGTWHPDGPEARPVSGCLATLRVLRT